VDGLGFATQFELTTEPYVFRKDDVFKFMVSLSEVTDKHSWSFIFKLIH